MAKSEQQQESDRKERKRERKAKQHQIDYTPKAPVHGIWTMMKRDAPPNATRSMDFFIGFGSWLKGNYFFDNAGPPFVGVGRFDIEHDYLEDLGVRRRLVRAVGYAAVFYRVPRLRKFTNSPEILDIFKGMAGDEADARLHLGSVVKKDGSKVAPPEGIDAARDLLEMTKGAIGRAATQSRGMHLTLDLEGLSLSEWEIPILPRGQAPAPNSRIQYVP